MLISYYSRQEQKSLVMYHTLQRLYVCVWLVNTLTSTAPIGSPIICMWSPADICEQWERNLSFSSADVCGAGMHDEPLRTSTWEARSTWTTPVDHSWILKMNFTRGLTNFKNLKCESLCNGPFPSSKKSHFQSEAKCEAIDMKMIFNYDANKTHFHVKGFALSLNCFESEIFWNLGMAYFYQDYGLLILHTVLFKVFLNSKPI